ncbi:MAG: hypothetical protein Q9213_006166 [Squamulea squamosa]
MAQISIGTTDDKLPLSSDGVGFVSSWTSKTHYVEVNHESHYIYRSEDVMSFSMLIIQPFHDTLYYKGGSIVTPIMNEVIMSQSPANGVHTIDVHLNGITMDRSNGSHYSINDAKTKELHEEKLIPNSSKYHELYIPDDKPPLSRFAAKCHPQADEVCEEIDAFFSKHWPWENEQARNKFLAADHSRWTCWAIPLAKADRILSSVKVTTLFFLLDG